MTTGADPGFDQGGGPDRDRPKTAILGPQFCRILVLGPHFWWSGGGPGPRTPPPGSAPGQVHNLTINSKESQSNFTSMDAHKTLRNAVYPFFFLT